MTRDKGGTAVSKRISRLGPKQLAWASVVAMEARLVTLGVSSMTQGEGSI